MKHNIIYILKIFTSLFQWWLTATSVTQAWAQRRYQRRAMYSWRRTARPPSSASRPSPRRSTTTPRTWRWWLAYSPPWYSSSPWPYSWSSRDTGSASASPVRWTARRPRTSALLAPPWRRAPPSWPTPSRTTRGMSFRFSTSARTYSMDTCTRASTDGEKER